MPRVNLLYYDPFNFHKILLCRWSSSKQQLKNALKLDCKNIRWVCSKLVWSQCAVVVAMVSCQLQRVYINSPVLSVCEFSVGQKVIVM